MTIVEYEDAHALALQPELRGFELESLQSYGVGDSGFMKWCDAMKGQAIMLSFIINERVAAVFAGLKMNPTTIEIWAFTGDAVDDNVAEFWRASVRGIDATFEAHEGLTRAQCHVDARNIKSQAWLQKLGFINDTPQGLKNFGPNDETYFIYSKLNGGRHG